MSVQQALDNLYAAARAVNANAEIHEGLRRSYELLAEVLVKNVLQTEGK